MQIGLLTNIRNTNYEFYFNENHPGKYINQKLQEYFADILKASPSSYSQHSRYYSFNK